MNTPGSPVVEGPCNIQRVHVGGCNHILVGIVAARTLGESNLRPGRSHRERLVRGIAVAPPDGGDPMWARQRGCIDIYFVRTEFARRIGDVENSVRGIEVDVDGFVGAESRAADIGVAFRVPDGRRKRHRRRGDADEVRP